QKNVDLKAASPRHICAAMLLRTACHLLSSAGMASTANYAAPGMDDVLDRPALLERIESDADLLGTLVELYEMDSPSMVAEMRSRIASHDGEGLSHAAHKLKGSLLTLSAVKAADSALALEKMGRENRLDGAEAALAALEAALPRASRARAQPP